MPNSTHFNSLLIKTDVTAVKYARNFLCAGVGNVLHVFDTESQKQMFRGRLLKHCRIHGIYPLPRDDTKELILAVFGSREIIVVSFDIGVQECWELKKLSILEEFGDWIWAVKSVGNSNVLMILTAHNSVTLWDFSCEERTDTGVMCDYKCLSYSGIIIGNSCESCIVISGTMFKEIVIWQPFSEKPGLVLHTLKGHRGAIFSVFYCDTQKKISSTSDDRSIHIWDVKFKDEKSSSIDWKNATIKPYLVIYGHMSRVWRCVLTTDGKAISVGEDSQLRIWDENGDSIYHWETHQGASVWCVDFSEELKMIATGSKDGGLCTWPLTGDELRPTALEMSDPIKASVNLKCVALTQLGRVIAVTENGELIMWRENNDMEIVEIDQRFRNYCLLAVSISRALICLGSINGVLVIYKEVRDGNKHFIKLVDSAIGSTRIFSLHWLDDSQLLICMDDGVMILYNIDEDETDASAIFRKLQTLSLPPCKERWITSAIVFQGMLLCGDREGSIHLFEMTENDTNITNPTKSFYKVHGRLGVSDLCEGEGNEICSVGRDGYLRHWSLLDGNLKLCSVDKLAIKWPVRIFRFQPQNVLSIIGFNAVHFELVTLKERRQMLKHACGGGHRPWDFSQDKEGNMRLAYLKNKVVYNLLVPRDSYNKPLNMEGYHIRTIDCMRHLGKGLLITGAEDTTIRIASLDCQTGWVRTKSILRSHVSSIRAIALVEFDEDLIAITAGGRAQLKVWRINIDNPDSLKHTELASHTIKGDDHKRRPWESNLPTRELDPRYMDVNAFYDGGLEKIIINTACSDGTSRVFGYYPDTKKLQLEFEYSYHNHCLLHCGVITNTPWCHTISMATDGKVAFWELNQIKNFDSEIRPLHVESIHQSGINGFDYVISNGEMVLATGGDDTMFALTVFRLTDKENSRINVSSQSSVNTVHTSTITGVKLTECYAISTGMDQLVILWKWNYVNDTISLEAISLYHSVIPDIQGIVAYHQPGREKMAICIYGVGLELLELNL